MTVPKVFLLGVLLAVGYAQIKLSATMSPPTSPPTSPPISSPMSPSISSPMSTYMQTVGSQVCCTDNTMTVYGSATVQAAPDTATINLQVTVGAETVNAAVAQLTTRINSVLGVLTANGLTNSNYQVSSLSVYPNTTFSNGVSTVVGQIASESLTVTVPIVGTNTTTLGKIIDGVAVVNGIILNGISFDLTNKTDQVAQARSKAFNDAKKKALDYAASLQVCLGQLVTVIDGQSTAPVVQRLEAPLMAMSRAEVATPTNINPGTISISYNVQAAYAFN